MSATRKRKAASRMLGIAIQQRLENLFVASGDTEVTIATVDLAQIMYENAEFIVWALKTLGGLNPPVPEVIKPIAATRPQPANDPAPLPVLPSALTGEIEEIKCTCDVLEAGIIGYAHMASCPQFEPA